MSVQPEIESVRSYLLELQDSLTSAFEDIDGTSRFRRDSWEHAEGGGGESRVLTNGSVFEQAGINFSLVKGEQLPPSATQRRPELEGAAFFATGVSLVIHPLNPYVPTTHLNVRFFLANIVPSPKV